MKNELNFKNFYVKPRLPDNLDPLVELSQNLWSTWDTAYRLFMRIDPNLFREINHNPVTLLQKTSDERLLELSNDKGFLFEMKNVHQKFRSYIDHKTDFPELNNNLIAYFSMEYGLHESLPIYSGGLGILSGDYLKAASDLGLPFVAFGLLYRYGYFSQKININGMQEEQYKENEWYSRPVQKVLDSNGEDLVISIKLKGENIYLKAWKIYVGKIPLYLLDSNLEKNKVNFRSITDYLYVTDKEMRFLQEIVLAFGSLDLMEKINLKPSVYHMNEGHSAFLIIKRLQNLVQGEKFTFEEAKDLIRSSSIFTTHTPVPAGNEKFEMSLVSPYLANETKQFGMEFDEFKKFAIDMEDKYFSLSVLAIRFSKYINGVSKLHSKVSKAMWHSIYPDLCEEEMPIRAITNGVHQQSWLSRGMIRLFDRYLGEDNHITDQKSIWENIYSVPDNEVWEVHQARKEQMVSFIRGRLQNSLLRKSKNENDQIGNVLNYNHLIIGFARRFATYKRADLILNDKTRLLRIIQNKERPVQFIFSGKAHPADEKGKQMIKAIIDFARENKVEDRFLFIEDYDINIARHLIQGVDVWLNNPIKPLEASGTSGMKAGMNGVLNLSVLDGWWDECYRPENGWSIESGENIEDLELRATLEANEIYEIIENEVTKLFYDRNKNGLPENWVMKMKHSIVDIGKQFNMHRVLWDYYQEFYLKGIQEISSLKNKDFESLKKLQLVKQQINKYWDKISFTDFTIETLENKIVECGEQIKAKAEIDLDMADESLFQVEIYYKFNDKDFKIIPLNFVTNNNNIAVYEGSFETQGSGKQSYNVRLRPKMCCGNEFPEFIKWYY